MFGEVDFKRGKISGVEKAWESEAGQVELKGEEGREGMGGACRDRRSTQRWEIEE